MTFIYILKYLVFSAVITTLLASDSWQEMFFKALPFSSVRQLFPKWHFMNRNDRNYENKKMTTSSPSSTPEYAKEMSHDPTVPPNKPWLDTPDFPPPFLNSIFPNSHLYFKSTNATKIGEFSRILTNTPMPIKRLRRNSFHYPRIHTYRGYPYRDWNSKIRSGKHNKDKGMMSSSKNPMLCKGIYDAKGLPRKFWPPFYPPFNNPWNPKCHGYSNTNTTENNGNENTSLTIKPENVSRVSRMLDNSPWQNTFSYPYLYLSRRYPFPVLPNKSWQNGYVLFPVFINGKFRYCRWYFNNGKENEFASTESSDSVGPMQTLEMLTTTAMPDSSLGPNNEDYDQRENNDILTSLVPNEFLTTLLPNYGRRGTPINP